MTISAEGVLLIVFGSMAVVIVWLWSVPTKSNPRLDIHSESINALFEIIKAQQKQIDELKASQGDKSKS